MLERSSLPVCSSLSAQEVSLLVSLARGVVKISLICSKVMGPLSFSILALCLWLFEIVCETPGHGKRVC
jgi:hypothetical protein